MTNAIKPRERSRILKSLKVGVVPNQGAHHYQVGIAQEVNSIITELNDLVFDDKSMNVNADIRVKN